MSVNNNKKKRLKTEIGAEIEQKVKKKLSITDLKAWEFLKLPEPIMRSLSELGFEKPTQIQELSLLPAILGRRDILGAAETGSGKTLAFGLPILSGILKLREEIGAEAQKKRLYALVLTPTRELAVQVKNHLQAIGRRIGIKVAAVIGGMASVKQERVLASGPEIIVATPGRLWELIQQGEEHLSRLDEIR